VRAARGSGVRAGRASGSEAARASGPEAARGRRLRASGACGCVGTAPPGERRGAGAWGRRVRAAARAEELPRARISPAAQASRLRHGARDRRVYSNHGVGQQV